jgi:putative ABC transport system permease protein
MVDGRWFDEASAKMPTVVLGSTAASLLGARLGQKIWIGQSWWAVIGIIGPLPGIASQLNSAAFLAPDWAEQRLGTLPISQIIVNAYPGQADAVKSVMAVTVNPAKPSGVDVSKPSPFGYIQDYIFSIFRILGLGLGAIALLVGGIGIANTMVVSVMERRGEIGLRRALGARTGQIGLQFVLEAGFIGFFGGILGVAFGVYVVFCFTALVSISFTVPFWVIAGGPVASILIGILAGLYPSLKAARQSPTVTLRAV